MFIKYIYLATHILTDLIFILIIITVFKCLLHCTKAIKLYSEYLTMYYLHAHESTHRAITHFLNTLI